MNTEIQTQSETVSESEALVLREENEGLVTLTLNRPRQFNALSEEVLAALQWNWIGLQKNSRRGWW